jgi:nucleoside-diphosphate-sugar epimerase
MNVLITGGAGYIGSMLVRKLLSGTEHSVFVVDTLRYGGIGITPWINHPRFTLIALDITEEVDCETLLRLSAPMDAIVHLAALRMDECNKNPQSAYLLNDCATVRLARIAARHGVKRFLFASSGSVYGGQPGVTVSEEGQVDAQTLYARTKLKAEPGVLGCGGSMCVSVLRFATVFGISPNMRWNLLVNELVRNAHEEKYLDIYDRRSSRALVHVYDLANLLARFLEVDEKIINGQIFNVGGFNRTKQQLVEAIQEWVPLEVDYTEIGGGRDYRMDFSKMGKLLMAEAKTTPEQGIENMLYSLDWGVWE